jgi:GNAT superfamily N-acetyltransferase
MWAPSPVAETVDLFRCDGRRLWSLFRRHHYLSGSYNGHGAICGVLDGNLVGFTSYITYPSGTIPQPARRGHRTVILPDYQGMGIGVRLSDALGMLMLREGYRYFSKTSHPRMGGYRNNSPLWKPTSKNEMAREDSTGTSRWELKRTLCFSHEFIGDDPNLYATVLANIHTPDTSQLSLFDDGLVDTEQRTETAPHLELDDSSVVHDAP